MMSNLKPSRRDNPLLAAGGRVDPDVASHLERTARLRNNGSRLTKKTVRLPTPLVEALRQQAYQLTGKRNRGFRDMLVVCAEYGLAAFLNGDLEIELEEQVTVTRIVAKHSLEAGAK